MNLQDFQASLTEDTPPSGLTSTLQAMWYEAKGDWDAAHTLIQDDTDGDEAWVHAYLHRQEGDEWNAKYWYSRAGRVMPDQSLEQEWDDIVTTLLVQQ